MKIMTKTFDILEKILCVCLGILMVLLTLDISLQVLSRYVFSSPPTWTEELARRIMQLIVFAGAGVAYRKSEMSGITLLLDHLPEHIKRTVELFTHLCIFAFCIFLVYVGYQMCLKTGNQLSPALRIPKWPFLMVIPFFGVVTSLFAIEKITKKMKGVDE